MPSSLFRILRCIFRFRAIKQSRKSPRCQLRRRGRENVLRWSPFRSSALFFPPNCPSSLCGLAGRTRPLCKSDLWRHKTRWLLPSPGPWVDIHTGRGAINDSEDAWVVREYFTVVNVPLRPRHFCGGWNIHHESFPSVRIQLVYIYIRMTGVQRT